MTAILPKKYGYARVSTTDQSLDIQTAALDAYGCDVIRSERISGASIKERVELNTLLQFIRQGDSLVVTRVDRLARSMGDLQDILRSLKSKGAILVITEQNIDTSTASGKAFLDMLGVFAEFETNLRAERQREGIAKAKAEGGIFRGRPPGSKHTMEQVAEQVAKSGSYSRAARALGVHPATIKRSMRKAREAGNAH